MLKRWGGEDVKQKQKNRKNQYGYRLQWRQTADAQVSLVNQYETWLTHLNRGMIGESKEFEDVGRVASSFPIYLGKTKVALLAEYI